MSTVRLLPLAAPVAAGVAAIGGAAFVVSLIGLLVSLLLARAVVLQLRNGDPTDLEPHHDN